MYKIYFKQAVDALKYFLPQISTCCAALLFVASAASAPSSNTGSGDIHVSGPGISPQLFFACGDKGIDPLRLLFANPEVVSDLKDLHAGLALAVPDFSAERAQIARTLNAAGIPLIAWIELPNDGVYFNASDIPQARAAVTAFEKWTAQYGLLWAGIGLDIEPSFTDFADLNGHRWRLLRKLAGRYFDYGSVYRARADYAELIRQMQRHGYPVQTYQLPFIVNERRMRATLLERLLGIVDVRGNEEAVMIYSSFAPSVGAAMIWTLGPDAQAITIGSTEGDPNAGPKGVPLDWEHFSRDLIVASHFSHTLVGVYNLEGSVQQGFLSRLKTMNWRQSVVIPAASIQRAHKIQSAMRIGLWIGSWLPVLLVVFLLLLFAWLLWRRRARSLRTPRDPSTAHLAASSSRRARIGPTVTLLLLAPVVSELLYGAMRLSVIFILIPEIMTWGCAALLIREWVRRWRKGWQSMLLLGLALAVAEECVIQQTSIAPLAGLAKHAYGRVWDVNWVYFLWALGYESVWVVLVPVQFTELLFPARREETWLRTRGLIVASIVFVFGAFMAWYGWTQRARVNVFHMPRYSPPPLYIAAALATILLLIAAACALPQSRPSENASQAAPAPWSVGLLICMLGSPWAALVLLGYGFAPAVPFQLVLAAGLAWGILTFYLVKRWTSRAGWGDAHRFALVFGGVLACMLGGLVVFNVAGALRIDWIGKIVLNVAALAWLIWLGRRIAPFPVTRPRQSSS